MLPDFSMGGDKQMILSNDVLSSLLTGAVYTENGPLGVRPCRFSRRHLEQMKSKEAYMVRAAASSGMMLDFKTDSSKLSFCVTSEPAAATPWFGMDVMVDGHLVHHIFNRNGRVCEKVQLPLSEGFNRVTVFLPNLCSVWLSDFMLDDGANCVPAAHSRKLLFIGDSITQGYTTEHPSRTYANLLMQALDAECLNQAIGGEVYNAAQLDDANGYQPDLIIAAYGCNDWKLKYDLTENAGRWYERLHEIYGDVPVCVLLPVWRTDIPQKEAEGREPFLQARQRIAEVCRQYPNCRVIDTYDFVPHDLAFFEDHVHPNEAGFALYADAVLKALK